MADRDICPKELECPDCQAAEAVCIYIANWAGRSMHDIDKRCACINMLAAALAFCEARIGIDGTIEIMTKALEARQDSLKGR